MNNIKTLLISLVIIFIEFWSIGIISSYVTEFCHLGIINEYISFIIVFLFVIFFIFLHCLLYKKFKKKFDMIDKSLYIIISIMGIFQTVIVWIFLCFEGLFKWKDNITEIFLNIF